MPSDTIDAVTGDSVDTIPYNTYVNPVDSANTYDLAAATSPNGVTWGSQLASLFSPLTQLATTGASLYGTLTNNDANNKLAQQKAQAEANIAALKAKGQSSTMTYLVIAAVVLVVGLLGFGLLRRGK